MPAENNFDWWAYECLRPSGGQWAWGRVAAGKAATAGSHGKDNGVGAAGTDWPEAELSEQDMRIYQSWRKKLSDTAGSSVSSRRVLQPARWGDGWVSWVAQGSYMRSSQAPPRNWRPALGTHQRAESCLGNQISCPFLMAAVSSQWFSKMGMPQYETSYHNTNNKKTS